MTAIKYKKVAEVCEIIMGQSPSSDTYNDRKEGLPFFQGKADFGKLHPTPKTYCSAPLKVANENDILMSVRAPVGDVNIANTKCCIGRGLAAIRANNDMINYKYLFYALNYKKNEIESMGTGSTFKAISKKDIESIQIPVFDIENQVKIVKALDKAQELINKRKAQIEALDQLTQSVFLEMFGDPATNPKKWPMGFIKDLALKTQYGTSKKASEDTGKYPILRMNNITYEGHWDLTDLKYVDLDDKEVGKYLVHKGELLFNRTNSKELVGKTAVYRFEKPMAFAGYLVKLIPNEKANAEFISAYLNSKYGKSILFSMAKNIVGMANINAEELKSIKIYMAEIRRDLQRVLFGCARN
ncbi:restriction endonuclease subunit S [Anoxybacillus flavithermus]